jgi:hypothetical protein
VRLPPNVGRGPPENVEPWKECVAMLPFVSPGSELGRLD